MDKRKRAKQVSVGQQQQKHGSRMNKNENSKKQLFFSYNDATTFAFIGIGNFTA